MRRGTSMSGGCQEGEPGGELNWSNGIFPHYEEEDHPGNQKPCSVVIGELVLWCTLLSFSDFDENWRRNEAVAGMPKSIGLGTRRMVRFSARSVYYLGVDIFSTRTTVHSTFFPAVVFNLPLSPSSSYVRSLPTTKSIAFTEVFGLVRQV